MGDISLLAGLENLLWMLTLWINLEPQGAAYLVGQER